MINQAAGLEVRGVSKIYPGTTALADVDLEVHPGELVALLGENGAGKSTLAAIIAGLTQPSSGQLAWRGQPYAPTDPREAIGNGIGLIHQEMRLLPDLTVAENVVIGRWPTRGGFLDRSTMRARAAEQLDRLGFHGRMDSLVRDLSVAGQQQVEIAKAMLLDANLLILDEPTAALGAAETDALFETVLSLKAEGMSFVYVSHRLSEIARIADRIVVLRDGHKIAEHDSGQVDPDQLVAEMVGRSVTRLFPERTASGERVMLEVADLTSRDGRFADISFQVREGEVFGVAGIVGAGRTEIVRAIAGADQRVTGTIMVDGRPIGRGGPVDAIAAGLVLVPEDRKQQGLVVGHRIDDNVVLPNLRAAGIGGWLGRDSVRRFTERVINSIGIKGRASTQVAELSGGNQQKVVIGKWLAREPKVIILDEPTRGIDVGARAAIYQVISDLAAHGAAVVVVSSDLDEVLGLAHRVMVIAGGQNKGVLTAAEAVPERVMALATVGH